jgi:hypothetical protein
VPKSLSWPPALSSEERLLLLFAQGRLTAGHQPLVQTLLDQGISWPLLLEKAKAHGVTPLLYQHLQRLGLPGIPSEVIAALKGFYAPNAMHNTLLARELTEILRRLAAADVPAIPFKGVTLAAALYGDLALRVCADLDILVPQPLVRRAVSTLQGLGYNSAFTQSVVQSLLTRTHIEMPMTRVTSGMTHLLELHWGIFQQVSRERAVLESLWAEAQPTLVFGVRAWQPTPEWQLLLLALHAARHHWRGVKWLSDIHELSRGTPIDWSKVRSQAERADWLQILEITLTICHTLFGTAIHTPLSLRPLPAWVRPFPSDAPATYSWMTLRATARLIKRPLTRWRFLLTVRLLPTRTEAWAVPQSSRLSTCSFLLQPLWRAAQWGWELTTRGARMMRSIFT